MPATIYGPPVVYPAQGAGRITLIPGVTLEEVIETGAKLRQEALKIIWHIERGDMPPSKLEHLFESHPGLLCDPEIRRRCGNLIRSPRFRRGRGHRASNWRLHPLVIHGLVTDEIEKGRAKSIRDACEKLAELLNLESASIRRLFYQAQTERRFSPYVVVNPVDFAP